MDPIYDTHTLDHDPPARIEQRLSNDLAQHYKEENHSSCSLHQSHEGLNYIYNSEKELPPRPESRMDFVLESRYTQSTNALNGVELKTQVRSHKRTPSATLRWTREILKKIRLAGATLTSDSDAPPCPNSLATVEPPIAATLSTYEGSNADDCMMITSDIALMSSNSELNSSATYSSFVSTSSSGSYPALDDISISLSSSSELDSSFEDTDGDSDSDLDSFKEIDLGDGLSEDARNVEYVVPVKGEQTYESSHVHTYSPVPASPSISQSPVSSAYLADSHTASILESFPTDNGDPNQSMLDYAPEPRTKYTCLPSPLSLFPPVVPSTFLSQSTPRFPLQSDFQPQRHMYDDRGYSRHALHYRKWFWALREEDWARYAEWLEGYHAQQEAYTGMSTSPVLGNLPGSTSSGEDEIHYPAVQGWQPESGSSSVVQGWQPEFKEGDQLRLFPSLFTSARESLPNNCRQRTETTGCVLEDIAPSPLPPLTIHPRWGDFTKLSSVYSSAAACTETWCMHTDRYLLVGMGLGLWTIRKVLWLFELNRVCTLHRSHEGTDDEEEEEKTFVVDGGTKDAASGSEDCSTDNESLSEDDDDPEEGEVMYSSVVSLASLISTTASSDDSDVTLVESDSDLESPTDAPSASALSAQADSYRSGRSIDFDKTCSSSCDSLANGIQDFEEVDLGLGTGSSDVACSSSTSGSSGTETGSCSSETESLALLRTLYLDAPVVPASTTLKGPNSLDAKGKCRKSTFPQWGMPLLSKRSWYEQCEFLLEKTGARETLA
ncbi:hypothetical protein GGU10DRAFT_68827 [Lentinula aff. detonsa]|uniref:Uncharacterized protein n=1 Tax=Lentinula aff. detonsa TaxID=2804958 RepID=A0AA38K8V4_9AGAR|nr:hypothetical protein GGU10DRAFT_68827 [Lentinula aff. detonsa]